MQQSVSLKYEAFSEPLLISVRAPRLKTQNCCIEIAISQCQFPATNILDLRRNFSYIVCKFCRNRCSIGLRQAVGLCLICSRGWRAWSSRRTAARFVCFDPGILLSDEASMFVLLPELRRNLAQGTASDLLPWASNTRSDFNMRLESSQAWKFLF